MSTHKKPNQLHVAPSNGAAGVDALTKSFAFAAALPTAQQEPLRARVRKMPTEVIELIANLADQSGGQVGGFAFDAAAARDALARSKDSRAIAKAARRLARRAESDALRNQSLVADRAMAATQALTRVVRTPEGEGLQEANDQVRVLMRAAGAKRKKAKAKVTATTTTTGNGASINAPATVAKPTTAA